MCLKIQNMNNRNGFKVGHSVVIDPNLLKSNEPQSWKNLAKITGIVKDEELTKLNKIGIQIFRIEIEFETLPYQATPDEIEMFGHEGCYTASVLPRLLRKV